MVVGATPSIWNFGSTGPRWSEIADFEPIFAHSASSVTSSRNTNRKSTTRFQISLRWSSYVAHKPQKWGSKMQNGRFGVKSHFTWKKSATKFPCVKTVSDIVVRHSLANDACKMIGGRRALLSEILRHTDRIRAKSPIFDLFSIFGLSEVCSVTWRCSESQDTTKETSDQLRKWEEMVRMAWIRHFKFAPPTNVHNELRLWILIELCAVTQRHPWIGIFSLAWTLCIVQIIFKCGDMQNTGLIPDKKSEHFDIRNIFLCHHIQEL